MKRSIPLLFLVCLTGCSSTNIAKVVEAMGKDHANVTVKITSVYGTCSIVRVNGTNAITAQPDGTITVKP